MRFECNKSVSVPLFESVKFGNSLLVDFTKFMNICLVDLVYKN